MVQEYVNSLSWCIYRPIIVNTILYKCGKHSEPRYLKKIYIGVVDAMIHIIVPFYLFVCLWLFIYVFVCLFVCLFLT